MFLFFVSKFGCRPWEEVASFNGAVQHRRPLQSAAKAKLLPEALGTRLFVWWINETSCISHILMFVESLVRLFAAIESFQFLLFHVLFQVYISVPASISFLPVLIETSIGNTIAVPFGIFDVVCFDEKSSV